MLTTEEIKKELDAGREVELECVDEEGFITSNDKRHSLTNATILGRDEIKVDRVEITGAVRLLYGRALWDSELKYFRIKRPAPTFDDLIDVAVKALKDKILQTVNISDKGIEFVVKGNPSETLEFGIDEARLGIDFINDLQTETFVIESEEDVAKFKAPVESILLANGEDIINDVMFYRNKPYFTKDRISMVKVGFNVLKGATVTQKRGEV